MHVCPAGMLRQTCTYDAMGLHLLLHGAAPMQPPTRVVVLHKGDGARGPHAQQAGRPPLAVNEAPVLAAAHGLLQDACGPTHMP